MRPAAVYSFILTTVGGERYHKLTVLKTPNVIHDMVEMPCISQKLVNFTAKTRYLWRHKNGLVT